MKPSQVLTRSNAIRLAGLLLASYISMLIGLVYLGQQHLRQALYEQAQLTIEKQAAAVNYFLSEEQDEIMEFTSHSPLHNFFANRALGMSMEYGLRASLLAVGEELQLLFDRNKLQGRPVYKNISFVDRDGTVLISAGETRKEEIENFSPDINTVPAISLHISSQDNSYSAYYSAAVNSHGQVNGFVVAEINLADVLLPLLRHSVNDQADNSLFLVGPRGEILVSTAGPAPSAMVFFKGEQPIISIPIDDSGYTLKGVVKNNNQILLTSHWILVALALITVPVMGGIYLLLRLNNKHIVLQARYLSSRRQQRALRHFRRLLDLSSDLIAVIDPETSRYLDVNQTMCRFFSLKRDQLLQQRFIDHSHKYQTMEQWRLFLRQIKKKGRMTTEDTGLRPDNSRFFMEINVHYVQNEKQGTLVAILRDISKKKETELALQRANQRVSAVIAGIDAVVYVSDMHTHEVLYANVAAVKLYGDLIGTTCWQSLEANQSGPCSFCVNDRLLDEDGKPTSTHSWDCQNTSNGRWFHRADCAIPWDDGRYVHLQIATDITERINNEKALQEAHNQLEDLAYYDPLTRLANRRLFIDRVNHAFARVDRDQTGLAICYLDLDGFKSINDIHGHELGDELLVQVSDRLRNILRGDDTVARWGGDEFALLINGQQDEKECANTLTRLFDTLASPYEIRGHVFNITASVGVTIYPRDSGAPETLLRHADQAMYIAKQQGRNGYYFFDPEQDRRVHIRQAQLNRIGQAIATDELRLFYQPKVDMAGGRILGVEALVRWQHPDQGMLSPIFFLPMIEGHKFQFDLDWWVLNRAMQQSSIWQNNGLELSVSVNVAPKTIQQPGFADRLIQLLEKYAIDGIQIELEILESGIIEELDTVSSVIQQCAKHGITFALDDYGTGFSSLAHIRRLPVQTMKIDQSFVKNMLNDKEDFNIVEGVIGLAQAFELRVIAEGVESTEIGLRLLELGCRYAQGYTIAKPMPSRDISNWFKEYRPPAQWAQYARSLQTGHLSR